MFQSRGLVGLSLIELMLVLVVLAILVSVLIPSMQTLRHSGLNRNESNRLLSAINLTRSEAITRNDSVSLCPSPIARTGQPVCAGSYDDGWMVFSNQDGDGVVDSGVDQVIRVYEGLPQGYRLTNRGGTLPVKEVISYLPDGSSRRNRTLQLCPPPSVPIDPWSVVISSVGRPRLVKGWGECPSV